MPDSLTDNQIASIYTQLLKQYRKEKDYGQFFVAPQPAKGPLEIYSALYWGLKKSIEEKRESALYGYNLNQVLPILYIFWQTTPEYKEQKTVFNFINQPVQIYQVNTYPVYCPHHNGILTWLMLSQLLNPPRVYVNTNSNSGSKGSQSKSESYNNLLALILILFCATLILIAFVYMFNALLNDLERLWYKEGWLQAIVDIASMGSFMVIGAGLTTIFGTPLLVSLALGLGISNPAGFVIFSIITLVFISGAVGHFISDKIQHYYLFKNNPNAMDPEDPYRFCLTPADNDNLLLKGLDPLKVKCAMIAARHELGPNSVSSFIPRLFWNNKEQKILDQIRALRRGENRLFSIQNLQFDLSYDHVSQACQAAAHHSAADEFSRKMPRVEVQQNDVYGSPSAPSIECFGLNL